MKVALNWLKDYLTLDLPEEQIGEILTDIGLEVEGMESVEQVKGGLKGIVIGHVKTCGKHPGADKLSVTTVDVGGEEDLHIVCGAPNVAAGQKVLVATIGTILYDDKGEPFKIKKGKIRGEVSMGMICAEDELGLGDSHDGIMVLPEDAKVGTLAKDYFDLQDETVYEIGLTPNRSDATAHLGVAQDLAAALKINYDHSGDVKTPPVSDLNATEKLPISVEVENTTACPRYAGVVIKNIKVGASPDWLKTRLEAIGVRTINNVVDITNYVLHELGQPLHAFDYDKITGKKVIVKNLASETPFLCLDEEERKLHEEDLMICDGEGKGMCMAGVFGGLNSGVTEATTTIFLESAYFDAKTIRKTSTRHLLRTDAAVCYEKGSDPNVVILALKRAAYLLSELAGGEVASEVIDLYPTAIEPVQVDITYKNVRRLIGVDIPQNEIEAILKALNIEILSATEEGMKVAIPTNKADVLREVDVIEEILRIYGFNKVPVPTQVKNSVNVGEGISKYSVRNSLANYLNGLGFNEMMGISLTQSRYFEEILKLPKENLVYVNNTSNMHLDVMRPTMLFSGLEAIVRNQNRQHPDLKIFESGFTYTNLGEKGFAESEKLTLFVTGQKTNESWHNTGKAPASYYTLKGYVEGIMQKVGVGNYQTTELNSDDRAKSDEFSYGLRYHRGPQTIVDFGKVKASLANKMDIKNEVFYAVFDMETVMNIVKKHKINYTELTKYPTVRRDLALVIGKNVKFDEVKGIATKYGKKILKAINLFDVYESEEHLGEGKKSYAVSFVFEDTTKTLKDKDVDKLMNNLIKAYEDKLGAVIRR